MNGNFSTPTPSATSKLSALALTAALALGASVGAPGAAHALEPWDQLVNGPARFTSVLVGGMTYRDNETGLVWQGLPALTPVTWFAARFACENSTGGGRMGWRLPLISELTSLLNVNTGTLPAGHPFMIVGPGLGMMSQFWSGSLASDDQNMVNGINDPTPPATAPAATTPIAKVLLVTGAPVTGVAPAVLELPANAVPMARAWCVRAPGSGLETSY